MIALIGIIKKELKISFTTPVAYVVFFFFTVIQSLLFWLLLIDFESSLQRFQHFEDPELVERLNFNDSILSVLYVNMQLFLMLLTPILTMRLIAEEKKHKTMELLMTSPIRPWQIAVGKYAAYLIMLVGLCSIGLVYPVLLTVYGSSSIVGSGIIDWNTTFMGLVGLFLAGAMFGAIGFAFSAVTENQVVAALVSILVLLVLWFLAQAGAQTQGWLGDVFTFVSPVSHIENFAQGVLDLGDVLYYVALTAVFFLFAHRMIEGQRWT
jgi:ABC-2 type transport system permease protein